jgi:hypothetical protein
MFAVFWFFAGLSSLGIARIGLEMDFGSEGWGLESLRRATLARVCGDGAVSGKRLVAIWSPAG